MIALLATVIVSTCPLPMAPPLIEPVAIKSPSTSTLALKLTVPVVVSTAKGVVVCDSSVDTSANRSACIVKLEPLASAVALKPETLPPALTVKYASASRSVIEVLLADAVVDAPEATAAVAASPVVGSFTVDVSAVMLDAFEVILPSAVVTRVVSPDTAVALLDMLPSAVVKSDCRVVISLA